jgi:hypothetical protein
MSAGSIGVTGAAERSGTERDNETPTSDGLCRALEEFEDWVRQKHVIHELLLVALQGCGERLDERCVTKSSHDVFLL